MSMRYRLLALAGLAALPLFAAPAGQAHAGAAHAGAATARAMLRYHFVAGARYSDQITTRVTVSVAASGVTPVQTSQSLSRAMAHFHVLRVDAKGNATTIIQIGPITVNLTTGGQTRTQTVPAQSELALLRPDGSMRAMSGAGSLNLNIQSFGLLPSQPVAVGAHWTSHATVMLATPGSGLPAIHLTARNTFTAYHAYKGLRAAVISVSGTIGYITDTMQHGARVHLHMSGTVAGQLLFGLMAGRTLRSHVHEDLRLFIHSAGATGGATATGGARA